MKDALISDAALPPGWVRSTIAEALEFRRGLTYKKSDEVEYSENAVLRANNVDRDKGVINLSEIRYIRSEIEIPAKKRVIPNSLLICTASGSRNHLGKVAFVDNLSDYAFGGFMGLMLPRKGVDAKYVYYFTRTAAYWKHIGGLSAGANINNLRFDDLGKLQIPLPPLEEQKRIVAVLDQAFAALDRARAQAEASLADAEELFSSVLSEAFNPDEPWELYSVAELVARGVLKRPIDGNHGETHPKKADFVECGVPFIMASDLMDGVVDQSGCYFLSRKQADALRKGFAKNGDVLLSHKGTIGRAALLDTDLDYVMLTPQVTYYRVADPDLLDRHFLYFCMRSSAFQRQMIDIAGAGATRAYIGITRQLELSIPLPRMDVQRELIHRFREVEERSRVLVVGYSERISDMADLRHSLLERAFSGQLTA